MSLARRYFPDEHDNQVRLQAGMHAMVFEPDIDDDGNPAALIATGVVEPSPDWLQCKGSRGSLRIDEHGVRHRLLD